MNNLYFGCVDCKIYIDCGGRWAYYKLESAGIVSRAKPVDVESVLAAAEYWNPSKDDDSRWLYQRVFPPLRDFLQNHRTHRVLFGEKDDFAPLDDTDFDWMQVGYSLMLSPRYLAEVVGLKSWDQVREYIEKQQIPPAWWEVTWGDPSPHELAKQRFQGLVSRHNG